MRDRQELQSLHEIAPEMAQLAEAAMRDCSIDSSELLPADMKLLQQWLKGEKG
jgi:hypothetical protein